MLSRLVATKWRLGFASVGSQQHRLACTSGEGGGGGSEPGQWRNWMEEKLKGQESAEQDPKVVESPVGESVADPSEESSGESASLAQDATHEHDQQENEGAVHHDLGGFPSSSPIFVQMSTEEAMQKRLDFLSKALESEVDPSVDVVKEKDEPAPKKELNMPTDEAEGYAELGMSNTPEDILELPKLHPNRMFMSGQTYQPQDLSPLSTTATGRRPFYQRPTTTYANEDALAKADFKNLQFLNNFVTDVGRIMPRRETKLKARVHRHVMRQVKIARQMALLPYQDRREEFRRGFRKQFENRDMPIQRMTGQTGQQFGP